MWIRVRHILLAVMTLAAPLGMSALEMPADSVSGSKSQTRWIGQLIDNRF